MEVNSNPSPPLASSINWYGILSDLVLLAHFAFVAFILAGFVLIWIGFFRKWPFVHNWRFRLAHLFAMGFVFLEALVGMACPLTAWENELRLRAGRGGLYEESFMQHWVGQVLYYDLSENAFTVLYALFFLLVVLTFVVVPPRRRAPDTPQHT